MVITVTGSTGTIGTELVALLPERGVATRAVLRDSTRLRPLPNVASVQADLRVPDLQAGAHRDLTVGPVIRQRDWLRTNANAIVLAAQRSGVEHV